MDGHFIDRKRRWLLCPFTLAGLDVEVVFTVGLWVQVRLPAIFIHLHCLLVPGAVSPGASWAARCSLSTTVNTKLFESVIIGKLIHREGTLASVTRVPGQRQAAGGGRALAVSSLNI